jgi:hypothetical protein
MVDAIRQIYALGWIFALAFLAGMGPHARAGDDCMSDPVLRPDAPIVCPGTEVGLGSRGSLTLEPTGTSKTSPEPNQQITVPGTPTGPKSQMLAPATVAPDQ